MTLQQRIQDSAAELGTRVSKALAKLAPQTQSSPVSTSNASPLSSVVLPSDKEGFPPDIVATAEKPASPCVISQQYQLQFQQELRRIQRIEKRLRADMVLFSRSIAEYTGNSQ